MAGLLPKAAFVGLEHVAHLAAGGEAPVLRSHVDAAARFLFDKGAGMPGRLRVEATAERARDAVARLLGVGAAEVAFLQSATEGLYVASQGIDWRPGDNVVVEGSEYPSVLHAWHRLEPLGVEVRRVGREAVVPFEALEAAVDARTRVLAASHVSYLTGARHDLGRLRALADRVGARLVVDASHALGVVPVDGALCDVLVSCCYKFLLGVHGIGVFHASARRWPDLEPPWVGWHSVEREEDWRRRTGYRLKPAPARFEAANLAYLPAYLLEGGLAALAPVGVAAIEAHVLRLGGQLRAGLVKLGLPVLTPEAPAERAANVVFASERPAAVEQALREAGVLVWAGDGRVRLSLHAYSDESDVARALAALGAIGGAG